MMPPPHGELTITWRQALAWRLRRHHLHEPADADAAAVARRLNGVQAQVMSFAELAIGLRAPGVTAADVAAALEHERSLVKTWTVRGTLHLLPAEDLPLWAAVLQATRPLRLPPAWLSYHGVSADDVHAVLNAIPRALDGRCLTREALAREAARISGRPQLEAVLKGGWGSLLKPVAYRGLLCFGPNEGRNVTFVRPEQWLGRWESVDPDQALDEILRRYLDAYGPAAPADFAHWFGLRPPEARRRFERLAPELVPVDVEGRRAWLTRAGAASLAEVAAGPSGGNLTADAAAGPSAAVGTAGAAGALAGAATAAAAETVRLVPGFDQYVIGALAHVEYLLPGPYKARISRPAGWISPALLVDGAIAGTWRHERRGHRLLVAIVPFAPLPQTVRTAAEAEAERIAAWLGTPAEVRWESEASAVPEVRS